MQKIYIEVTNLIKTNSVTGIQRVERSVALEMHKVLGEQLCFIIYNNKNSKFEVLALEDFIKYAKGSDSASDRMFSGEFITPDQMRPGDIFFEMDAVWNENYKSSVLLPELKRNGIRIACYIYDIIPIKYPQFSHFASRFNFMNYIGAYLQYADVIIASAQSTLDSIYELTDKLELPRIPGFVSWLGSDFNIDSSEQVSDRDIPENIKIFENKKFILSVGTIEPRKNHAFLLDAFEQGLFDKDINLVFAGKMGWNVEDLRIRMANHPEAGKRFFYLDALDDNSIDFLYSKALAVAVPTYIEGFGLPVVESLKRGTPVLASDIPVLREVGKDYCKYFELNNEKQFIEKVEELIGDKEAYKRLKDKIGEYNPISWKEVSEKIIEALDALKISERKAKKNVSQMVILTGRVKNIERSIPYIEKYMPFIDRILLCCPDKVAEEMSQIKTQRVKIDVLKDEELTHGKELPLDYGSKHFTFRCLAMFNDKVDEVFIMGDDDYRPLKMIDLGMYIENDSYVAYYCHRMNDWKGVVGAFTLYDHMQFRTREFVNNNRYPDFQYSSHMPQIIEKELYRDMINDFPGIEMKGLDEWSSYFNYVQAKYPDLIKTKPYVAANWPGLPTDWEMYVKPSEICFENYYEFSYDKGRVFDGLSSEVGDNTDEENQEKISRIKKMHNECFENRSVYENYCKRYINDRLENPSYVIKYEKDTVVIGAPEYIVMSAGAVMHIPFKVIGERDGVTFQLKISSKKGTVQRMKELILKPEDLRTINNSFNATLTCGPKGTPKGDYTLSIIIDDGKQQYVKDVSLKLV